MKPRDRYLAVAAITYLTYSANVTVISIVVVKKASSNKDVVMVVVSSEAPMSHPIVTTAPPSSSAKGITKGTTPENGVVNGSSNENIVVIASDEDGKANAETQDGVANVGSENHVEKINLTDPAITVQAALRGYQAHRKFEMLKGFIPLQGLIRGKLARREAVSALYCVNGIVKVQALARGYRVRHSAVIGLQVQKSFKVFYQVLGGVASTKAQKISDSVFVQKLLASSPAVLSRKLNYGWLERWTRSQFWAPVPELKKIETDEKNVLGQTVECDEEKGKRNARKGEAVRVDDGLVLKKESSMALHSSAKENEKRKQHMTRKSSDHAKKLAVSKSKESDVENHGNNFQRRASLPANYFKNESSENTSTPPRRVPSYMAPTESAKAKLRGQESPRFGSDLVFERNGINRRLSLSCSLNGKLGLVSPKSARFGNIASSKGMTKTDNRSLSTSRDCSVSDKLIQPEPQWRR